MEFDDFYTKTGLSVIIFDTRVMPELAIWSLRSNDTREIHLPHLSTACIGHPIEVRGEKYIVKDISVAPLGGDWSVQIRIS